MQRNVKLCRHQHDSHNFIQATKTTSVHLDVVQRFSLQELLEHDSILTVLAGSDLDIVFAECCADGRVAKYIVGGCGLLDEKRFERGEVSEIGLCFGNGPDLRR